MDTNVDDVEVFSKHVDRLPAGFVDGAAALVRFLVPDCWVELQTLEEPDNETLAALDPVTSKSTLVPSSGPGSGATETSLAPKASVS